MVIRFDTEGVTEHIDDVFCVHVRDMDGNKVAVYGRLVRVYKNVLALTCGIFEEVELVGKEEDNDKPLSYCSLMCTELPVDWQDKRWLDDNGKVQKIVSMDFEEAVLADEETRDVEHPCFVMEDGSESWGVTEVLNGQSV